MNKQTSKRSHKKKPTIHQLWLAVRAIIMARGY